jgi:hypothetical protein
MKFIGVIIGTDSGYVSKKYRDKKKVILKNIDNLEPYMKPIGNDIPYDYAIFCEFKNIENKFNCQVIPLYGPELNLKDANQCDFIFCIFESVFSFMANGYKGYNNYINVLKKTSAVVHPTIETQLFIINKQRYMKWLQHHGNDVIPTKFITVNGFNTHTKKTMESIYNFAENHNYKELIMKPELGAFAGGFKHFKRISDSGIKSYFKKVTTKGFKKILVQPYLHEFLKFWEIKTYWLDGQYLYSYGINVLAEKDDDYPVSEGGNISDDLIMKCRSKGEKIISDLFRDFGFQVQCRIDFGCCIENDNVCRDYFVNEIELIPTIIDDETKKDNFALLANSVLDLATKK